MHLSALVRALTDNSAATHPASDDPALRGRTYAIPFERVWRAALELADGGRRGWRLVRADDEEGVIEAEATTLVLRFTDDVRIEIGLDENAQTRVDVASSSRVGKADLGTNRRRIRSFLGALDRKVDAAPGEILEPRAGPVATV